MNGDYWISIIIFLLAIFIIPCNKYYIFIIVLIFSLILSLNILLFYQKNFDFFIKKSKYTSHKKKHSNKIKNTTTYDSTTTNHLTTNNLTTDHLTSS
jgi:hypothetical protein